MTQALLERLSEIQRYARLLAHHPAAETRLALLMEEWPQAPELMRAHVLWWARAQPLERLVFCSTAYVQGMECLRDLSIEQIDSLVESLEPTELFWADEGGLLGYQSQLLQLLVAHQHTASLSFHQPPLERLPSSGETSARALDRADWARVWQGLQALHHMAEIYPVGGAGDRLDLRHPETQEPLPVAMLPFAGKTLLEGLVEDLQAREWLLFRLTGQRVRCPVAMMTSWEKDNHRHIYQLCESKQWFGRGRSSFRLFSQPLVPAIDVEGKWIFLEPGRVLLKPGGHGAIWRLMEERGVLQWLREQSRTFGLTRQINNPLAGSDTNLLFLAAYGEECEAAVGFLSCARKVGAAEGMIVLVEGALAHRYCYTLQNIEYTDFLQLGWQDQPAIPGGDESPFPANTNILYISLDAVEQALSRAEHKGELLNLKPARVLFPSGPKEMVIGRLESTMQSLAEAFPTLESTQVEHPEQLPLRNLLLVQERSMTMSTAKKAYREGESFFETPVGCYLDWLALRLTWLRSIGWTVPSCRPGDPQPPCRVRWLPALSPLRSMMATMFGQGTLKEGSAMSLEVAEASLSGVTVDGTLEVIALQPYGRLQEGEVVFGAECGQLILENVVISNRGASSASGPPERCRILLKGASRFVARGVTLSGEREWIVEDGECVELSQDATGALQERRMAWSPQWIWDLSWSDEGPQVRPATQTHAKIPGPGSRVSNTG